MILNEIKDLIKELEKILIKDKRFKNSYSFKNQLKIIYSCKNNLNISQLPNIDITPFISNLITLNKPLEISKQSKNNQLPDDCKEALKKLIDKIDELYQSSVGLDSKKLLTKESISELLNNLKNNPEKIVDIINSLE